MRAFREELKCLWAQPCYAAYENSSSMCPPWPLPPPGGSNLGTVRHNLGTSVPIGDQGPFWGTMGTQLGTMGIQFGDRGVQFGDQGPNWEPGAHLMTIGAGEGGSQLETGHPVDHYCGRKR